MVGEVEKTKVEKSIVASPDVLVSVEGNPITALDLDLAVERTTGSAGLFQIDEKARKKILESLVMSKALGLAKEKNSASENLPPWIARWQFTEMNCWRRNI